MAGAGASAGDGGGAGRGESARALAAHARHLPAVAKDDWGGLGRSAGGVVAARALQERRTLSAAWDSVEAGDDCGADDGVVREVPGKIMGTRNSRIFAVDNSE